MANTLFTNVRIFDGTGEHPYLFEFTFPSISKQKILNCVIGNVQVHPSIVVDIGCNHPPSFCQ